MKTENTIDFDSLMEQAAKQNAEAEAQQRVRDEEELDKERTRLQPLIREIDGAIKALPPLTAQAIKLLKFIEQIGFASSYEPQLRLAIWGGNSLLPLENRLKNHRTRLNRLSIDDLITQPHACSNLFYEEREARGAVGGIREIQRLLSLIESEIRWAQECGKLGNTNASTYIPALTKKDDQVTVSTYFNPRKS